MADSVRERLVAILRSTLAAEFVQRGFDAVPLSADDALSPEIRSAFPFGRLRRRCQKGLELVEIQLDKHGRSAFRLNVGIATPEGVAHASGHIAQEDVWVQYLPSYFEVYRRPFFRQWFTAEHLGSASSSLHLEAMRTQVANLVSEVEDALARDKRGPHMRRVG